VEERKRSYSPRGSLVLAALDVLPDASIMVFDLDLVFVVVRGEALQDAGMDPHHLEERPASEALSPSRWAFYEPFYRAALAGESSSIEVGSVAADGRRYVVNVGPVRDRAGEVIGGVVIATDVTEHLRMRAALEESEARFRLVAENASDVVLRVDDEWDVGWVSPSVHEVLGYDAGSILGASLKSFLTDESWHTIWDAYGAWDKREPLRVLLQLVRADGSLRWMEVVARSIGDESVATTVVNLRDVDAQVHAQQALADSEEQFRLTMEQAGIGMALTSDRGEFMLVNPALARILGYDAAELVGRTFASITHPDDLDESRANMQRLLTGEREAISTRKRYLRKEGEEVWVDLTATAVRGTGGRLRHFAAQMVDVTAEVKAQAQLARSEERFRLAMTAAPMGMAISDPDGRFVQANDALCTMLDVDEAEILGRTITAFLPADELGLAAEVTRGLADARTASFRHQHRLVSPTRELWVEHSASVLTDESGDPAFYVHQFADHTEAHELRQDLEFRATHDALTGVANRWCCWTWTTSRKSTTPWATTRVTSCCARWPCACSAVCARPTPWHAWAATSSCWCWVGWVATPPWPPHAPATWAKRCARRWPNATTSTGCRWTRRPASAW